MNQLYDSALLADAAYLFFNQGLYNTGTGEIDPQVASVFKERGFTQDQFTYLRDTYKVKAHLPNTVTGLSLTIFENKNTHELTIAFRGTEPPETGTLSFLQDLFRDLVLAAGFDTLTGGLGQDPAIVTFLQGAGVLDADAPVNERAHTLDKVMAHNPLFGCG